MDVTDPIVAAFSKKFCIRLTANELEVILIISQDK